MGLSKKLALIFVPFKVTRGKGRDAWVEHGYHARNEKGVKYEVTRHTLIMPRGLGWQAWPVETADGHPITKPLPKGFDSLYEDTLEEMAEKLGYDLEKLATAKCKFCKKQVLASTARRHDGGYVGECCWDERLKATE